MKIQKSFELLNSEGPIIKLEKIEGHWHYNFHGSKTRHIITIKEVLQSLLEGKAIIDKIGGRIYFLNDYPESMKIEHQKIVDFLLEEELIKCKKDLNYFKEIYLS